MSRVIIFELNKHTEMMESDIVTIYDSFNYINWYNNSTEYILLFSYLGSNLAYQSIKDLLNNENRISIDFDNSIPVGSIEFVEKFLNKEIKAINIPIELRSQRFTGRHIEVGDKTTADNLLKTYNKLFIKDACRCKKFEPITYSHRYKGELPDKLFISTLIDIESEYRAFVFNGKILDCRQYIGKYSDRYDENILEEAINNWENKPSAFTLDIAVLKNNKTVLLEIHNFISCGLYGFNSTKLAFMTIKAFLEEKYGKRVGE